MKEMDEKKWNTVSIIMLGIIVLSTVIFLAMIGILYATKKFIFNPELSMGDDYVPPSHMFNATGNVRKLTPDEITTRNNLISGYISNRNKM